MQDSFWHIRITQLMSGKAGRKGGRETEEKERRKGEREEGREEKEEKGKKEREEERNERDKTRERKEEERNERGKPKEAVFRGESLLSTEDAGAEGRAPQGLRQAHWAAPGPLSPSLTLLSVLALFSGRLTSL